MTSQPAPDLWTLNGDFTAKGIANQMFLGEHKANMTRAAHLRSALETSLEQRIPSAFSPRMRMELSTIPTGIPQMDALLDGGLPVGAITEIVGSFSSGRLSCAQAFVAKVIEAGYVCAWIDVTDSFDPESAAGNGVDLQRLLWVRCGESPNNTPLLPSKPASFSGISRAIGEPLRSGGNAHPRNEVRGLSQALGTLLSNKPSAPPRRQVGTPGAPNRSLIAGDRVEQIASDRLPSRRGSYLLGSRERPARTVAAVSSASFQPAEPRVVRPEAVGVSGRPWNRLDQALRAADLLLQAGGFGALVLDLGGIDPQFASRVPLATWFRFRAAAERTRVSLVLLSQHPCAQSSAEIVLRTSLALPEVGTVLLSVPYTVERLRQRFTPPQVSNVLCMRKPAARASTAEWQADTLWARGQ